MASLIKEPNGRRRIDFTHSGKRRRIRLGDMPERHARAVLGHVEELAAASAQGRAPERLTSEWVGKQTPEMRRKLMACDLITAAAATKRAMTVGELAAEYLASADVRPATRQVYQQGISSITAFLDATTPLADVSALDADQWRRQLAKTLSEATTAKRVKVAKAMFRAAVKWRLIDESPFASVKVGSQRNKDRQRFIEADTIRHILTHCNTVWQARLSLLRWGGLRFPSETESLKWADIDFRRGVMTVRAKKTSSVRAVPLFPEVRQALERLKLDPVDDVYLFGPRPLHGTALRSQFVKILGRAKQRPWVKLFQNLRSTRQTELTRRFGAHAACAWLGNSERVAMDHYLQITDSDLSAAIAPDFAPPLQKPSDFLEVSANAVGREGFDTTSATSGNRLKTQANAETRSGRLLAVAGKGRAGNCAALDRRQRRGGRVLAKLFARAIAKGGGK